MMLDLRYSLQVLIQKLHYLSLDVVFGAVCSQYIFWKLPNGKTEIDFPTTFALACATWLIYILDRLIDAPQKPTNRHKFHQKHKKYLYIFCVFLGFLLLLNCCFLPNPVLKNGFVLGFITAFYLMIFVYWLNFYWLKEISTALIYTAGIVLPPYWISGETNIVLVFVFFLIALQNLLLFSWFEFLENPQTKNIIAVLGLRQTKILIALFSVLVCLNTFFCEEGTAKIACVAFLMSFCLLLIIQFANFFKKNERYRFWGDAVFFIPLLLAL